MAGLASRASETRIATLDDPLRNGSSRSEPRGSATCVLHPLFIVTTIMPLYEWDEAKREANLLKHGLDFVMAPVIHEAEVKLTLESPRGNELRWVDIAEVLEENLVLSLVYTRRLNAIRVVSLRKANRKERSLYVKAKNQPARQ